MKKLPFKAKVGWEIPKNFKILPNTLGCPLEYQVTFDDQAYLTLSVKK